MKKLLKVLIKGDWIVSPPSRGRLAMTNTGNPSLRVRYYEHPTVENDGASSLRGTKQSSLLINVLPICVIDGHEAIQSLNQRVTDLRH